MDVPTLTPAARRDNARLLAQGQGLLWETSTNRATGGTATIMVSGVQYHVLAPVVGGETITGLVVDVSAGGSSLTLVKLGLLSTSGTILASTADVKAAFTGTGALGGNFTTPYTPPADGVVYASIVCVGTTPPTLIRFSSGGYTPSQYNSNPRVNGGRTGQTDLAAVTPNSNQVAYWFGAY